MNELSRSSANAQIGRYAGYKDSGVAWLGEIPAHWEVRRFGSMAQSQNLRGETALPLLSVLREKGVVLRSELSERENNNLLPEDLSNYKVVFSGQLAINKMKAWQGSLGISKQDGVVSPAYYVYALTGISTGFAHRLLRSRPYIALFAQYSDGVRIGQWDLSPDRLKQLPILIPPLDEQAAIVKYLAHVDRKIDRFIRSKRRMIELLNEQKQAIIHQAVTKGLEPAAPMKDSGVEWLGEIPAHWELRPLRQMAVVQSGLTLGKDYGSRPLISRPYLRVANAQAGFLNLDKITFVDVPKEEIERTSLQVGDVLMTEGGDIDKLGRGRYGEVRLKAVFIRIIYLRCAPNQGF